VKYIVQIREVHIQEVLIEAESEQEAINKVADGDGQYLDNSLEYSHTLPRETFTVAPPDTTRVLTNE
jgi:hypothetical protein